MTYEQLASLAGRAGFTAWASLDPKTIELKPEVRDMCAANSCGMYGKRWSCPPGCGTLEACSRSLNPFSQGILVQTVGTAEDSFDFEAMQETENIHKAHFAHMYGMLKQLSPAVLAMGAGCCTRCAECTYPDSPCRFPGEMTVSMEAYGILVHELCRANHLPYYYGPGSIAFTSCFLIGK